MGPILCVESALVVSQLYYTGGVRYVDIPAVTNSSGMPSKFSLFINSHNHPNVNITIDADPVVDTLNAGLSPRPSATKWIV